VHLQRAEKATPALAAQLGLATGARVFHTLIVHHENGVPLQCEDRYVNPACAPALPGRRLHAHHADAGALRDHGAVARAVQHRGRRPTADEARLLGIPAREPCLIVTRRTFTRDAAITLARLVHPGSRYQLQGEFQP
jgi:GntR family transcriptional regulator, histidine utilization repressor